MFNHLYQLWLGDDRKFCDTQSEFIIGSDILGKYVYQDPMMIKEQEPNHIFSNRFYAVKQVILNSLSHPEIACWRSLQSTLKTKIDMKLDDNLFSFFFPNLLGSLRGHSLGGAKAWIALSVYMIRRLFCAVSHINGKFFGRSGLIWNNFPLRNVQTGTDKMEVII